MEKTSENGVWDQDSQGTGPVGSTFVKRAPNVKQGAKAMVVRDDWDDDDDDDDDELERDIEGVKENESVALDPGRKDKEMGEEDSSKIWEEANKKAPMPEFIVATASTSQRHPPPPTAALQPTLRILKRPPPNATGNNAGTMSPRSASQGPSSDSGSGRGMSPAPRGTLAEREAQYQEARNRIFGEQKSGSTNVNASPMPRTSSSSGVVSVVRDPLGPASESDMESQEKLYGSGRPAKGFGERRRGKK